MIYSLVYVSSAVELFTNDELEALLDKSRKNNHARDVTGMLLYKDGNFMQFLEGPRENVTALSEKIGADPRHRGMMVLLEEEKPERQFSEWSMGFKKYKSGEKIEIPGYTDFLNLPLTSEQFLKNPSRTLQLLLSFKKTVRAF
jgi:hypothetical protein